MLTWPSDFGQVGFKLIYIFVNQKHLITHECNYNTVELVQSDTRVFRHPVTSDSNLWFQF